MTPYLSSYARHALVYAINLYILTHLNQTMPVTTRAAARLQNLSLLAPPPEIVESILHLMIAEATDLLLDKLPVRTKQYVIRMWGIATISQVAFTKVREANSKLAQKAEDNLMKLKERMTREHWWHAGAWRPGGYCCHIFGDIEPQRRRWANIDKAAQALKRKLLRVENARGGSLLAFDDGNDVKQESDDRCGG